MIVWLVPIVALLLGLYTSRALTDPIRGVSLGGWLLLEEWYVKRSQRHIEAQILTGQDNAFPIS
jgi:hypothetical protein